MKVLHDDDYLIVIVVIVILRKLGMSIGSRWQTNERITYDRCEILYESEENERELPVGCPIIVIYTNSKNNNF